MYFSKIYKTINAQVFRTSIRFLLTFIAFLLFFLLFHVGIFYFYCFFISLSKYIKFSTVAKGIYDWGVLEEEISKRTAVDLHFLAAVVRVR